VQPCEASPRQDIATGERWLLVGLGRIPHA